MSKLKEIKVLNKMIETKDCIGIKCAKCPLTKIINEQGLTIWDCNEYTIVKHAKIKKERLEQQLKMQLI